MSWVSLPAEILLEMVFPHQCLACGRMSGLVPFVPDGKTDTDLRPWDRSHLCCHCYRRLTSNPPIIVKGQYLSGAAAHTTGCLVKLVGQWKYHGVRGLGWPLATMLVPVIQDLQRRDPVDFIVPIPLHTTRQRSRGFNQAAMLARLAGVALGIQVHSNFLFRPKNTKQQARLQDDLLRQENIQGAFMLSDGSICGPLRIGLIDDLVTTGSTTEAAAKTLRNGGFDVRWVASLGIAAKNSAK